MWREEEEGRGKNRKKKKETGGIVRIKKEE